MLRGPDDAFRRDATRRDATRPTVLVTGAAGFIGSHVTRALLARGRLVVAIDDLSGGLRDNVDPRATFVEGSIVDGALVDRLFDDHRFGEVFHLAAFAAEALSHFVRRFNYQNERIGSVNLINAAIRHEERRNHERSVFESSHPRDVTGRAYDETRRSDFDDPNVAMRRALCARELTGGVARAVADVG